MAEVVDGRFCKHCGGEFDLRRRKDGAFIVTFLLCPFCHRCKPTMLLSERTGDCADLTRLAPSGGDKKRAGLLSGPQPTSEEKQ